MGFPATTPDTTQNPPVHNEERLHEHLTKGESNALTESDLIVRSRDGEVNKFGSATVPQTGTIAITFSTAFTEVPTIAVTPKATVAGFDIIQSNVTASGFELGFNAAPGAPVDVAWLASL